MAITENFSEEEKKYFESRGNEDLISASEEVKESEDAVEAAQENNEDNSNEEYDQKDRNEDVDQESSVKDVDSDRDFKKAYAVAEEKRLEARRLFEEQKQKTSEMERRLTEITNYLQQQQQPVAPDKEEDPLAYQAYEIEQLKKQFNQQQQHLNYQNQYAQQQQNVNQAINRYVDEARKYSQREPRFSDAYEFLQESRVKELMAAGYNIEESTRLLQEDEMAIAAKAFQDGVNPGERIFAAAIARGFNANGSNQPQPPQSKLETVKKGIKNARNLSPAGSRNLSRELDMSNIDKMSADEFDKFFEKIKKEQGGSGSMFF